VRSQPLLHGLAALRATSRLAPPRLPLPNDHLQEHAGARGASGITPNPAPTVLRNKYGDCKDHVALMVALLRARGIASEQVLISMGNMYRLPARPAVLFNHVMLYLPEFRLYTDPTASSSAFGVLPVGSYDKPVLHISETGGRLARTPPMKPEDHTTMSRTVLMIGEGWANKR
jgi:hypothetical protein